LILSKILEELNDSWKKYPESLTAPKVETKNPTQQEKGDQVTVTDLSKISIRDPQGFIHHGSGPEWVSPVKDACDRQIESIRQDICELSDQIAEIKRTIDGFSQRIYDVEQKKNIVYKMVPPNPEINKPFLSNLIFEHGRPW
jgi:hypothetical protein